MSDAEKVLGFDLHEYVYLACGVSQHLPSPQFRCLPFCPFWIALDFLARSHEVIVKPAPV